jgi:hypothetical protein
MQLRRSLVWLWIFALLAAQSSGLLHRVAHGIAPTPGAALGQQVQWAHTYESDSIDDAHDHPEEHTSADCRLFDHLACGDAAPSVLAHVTLFAFAFFILLFFIGAARYRRPALFHARGPPSIR